MVSKASLGKQKLLFVDAILDVQKKLKAIEYLLWRVDESEKLENRITFDVYKELLILLHKLLFENIVVTLCWLFDKKGDRSLFWYLKEAKTSQPNKATLIDSQIKKIENSSVELGKIKHIRDKWLAHRDKVTFENPEVFWEKGKRPNIKDIKSLVATASEILESHFPAVDTTTHGIQKLFCLIETIVTENPEFLLRMKEHSSIEKIDYSELYSIVEELKGEI
jgi:hypothetical protein